MNSDNNFIVFGAPDIQEAEIEEVLACLRSRWLGTGPRVRRFEVDFARYKGVDTGLVAATNSCTAALHVSMLAAGIGAGDEVITTALTFCATVNSIIHSGAMPVLADVDPVTMNIDIYSLQEKITERTRAVVPVHFAGRPCDMEAVMTIARCHDLKVIEDCAHAIETEFQGRKAGTIGDFGCFSFYVTKNVTTGEGGMVIAREPEDIDQIKIRSLHGMTHDAWHRFGDDGHRHYLVTETGYKYNMTDLQASLGIHQLARVDEAWKRRYDIWKHYQEAFAAFPVIRPADPEPNTRHGLHLYTLRISPRQTQFSRDEFIKKMTRQKIGVGVHYLSIPEHPCYAREYGWHTGDYPEATRIGRETVSLPFSAALSDIDVSRVVTAVRDSLDLM